LLLLGQPKVEKAWTSPNAIHIQNVMNMEVSVRHANIDKNAKLKLRDYFLKGNKKADMENPYQLFYYTLSSDTHCQRMLLIREWGLSNCFIKKKLRCFSYGKVESFLI
jgi:hypothetical protein